MKKLYSTFMILLVMVSCYSAHAASPVQSLFKCDSTFFKNIENINALKPVLAQMKKINITADEGDFTVPVDYTSPEGITLTKFVINFSNFDVFKKSGIESLGGQFYYWGFETSQPLKEVVALLSKKNQLIKNGSVYIYNPMIRNDDKSNWQQNKTASSGIIPSAKSAEKLLIIEQQTKPLRVSILCSLQGAITKQDLIAAGLYNRKK